jgi:IS1 family transposase
MANVLCDEKRLSVLAALCDGNSIRAVERMTGVHRDTIMRFAVTLGENAIQLHNRIARGLSCSLVQCDEIWSFVGKKEKRATEAEKAEGKGEAYTFVALDQSSRFAISWYVGKRNEESAKAFMEDVRSRLVVMPAMTSDGFAPYVSAVGASFGKSVDYAQTIKNYGSKGRRDDDYRYEPPRDPFITKKAIFGAPDLDKASTAYIERQNGTMRHHIGRIRRLCLAFSKKLENHKAAISLGYLHYNLCLVVKTLRVTPAMAVGATDHIWDLRELLDVLLNVEPCEAPTKQPLASRVPEATHRELPNGKGFLRVIDGGKGKGNDAPKVPPTPPQPVRYAAAVVEDYEKHWQEMDAKLWKQREKRMDFFGDDESDNNPNW